ncbi:hypothetical protein BH09PSE6_BH09PSE6_15270 [soil metagenome]
MRTALLALILLMSGCGLMQQPRTGPDPAVYVAYVAETKIPFVVNSSVIYVVMNDRSMDPYSIMDGLRPLCRHLPKSSTLVEVFDSEEQFRWRSHDVRGPLSARLNVETGALVWNLAGPEQPETYDAGSRWCEGKVFTS